MARLTTEEREARKVKKAEYQRKYQRRYRQDNREAIAEKRREYYQMNREYFALKSAERRATKYGVPFSLTLDNLPPIPSVCPVFGTSWAELGGTGGCKPTSLSLDRIIPELGYIPTNVVWMSSRANLIKSNATPEELEKVAAFVRQLIA